MKKAFTMVELIMTIVIMGILAGGSYVSIAKIYTKAAKSKAISELSFDSTLVSNQIASLLYHRVPSTVIGYDPHIPTFESIYTLSDEYGILEWIGTDFEHYKSKDYSSFIDLDKSNPDTNMTYSPDTNISVVLQNNPNTALMFAGSFDEGSIVYGSDFNDSYGWHDNLKHDLIFELNSSTSVDENITLTTKPEQIFEKYYLLKSAYAIAKYEDINTTATCITDLNITVSDKTLFLFYNYHPWKGDTFCADTNGTTNKKGDVTILSNEAKGFEVEFLNGNLQFNLTLEREIKKSGKNISVQISKQKVVF